MPRHWNCSKSTLLVIFLFLSLSTAQYQSQFLTDEESQYPKDDQEQYLHKEQFLRKGGEEDTDSINSDSMLKDTPIRTTKRPNNSAHRLVNLLLRNRLSLAHRMANKRTREEYFKSYNKGGYLAAAPVVRTRGNPVSIVGLDNLHILVAGNNRAKSRPRPMGGGGRRGPFGAKNFLSRMRQRMREQGR